MKTKKYNVCDEYDRLIDEDVSLKRARATVKENPGSKLIEFKPHTAGRGKG